MAQPTKDWVENTPADTDGVSSGASDMRSIRDDVKDRFEREHVLDTSDRVNDGYHLGGSAVIYTSDSEPTTAPDGTALVTTASASADSGRLWRAPGGRLKAYMKATGAATTLGWEDVVYHMDQDVRTTDDVAFSSVRSTTQGPRTVQSGTFTSATITPPAGVYVGWIEPLSVNTTVRVQAQDHGGAWQIIAEAEETANKKSFFIISDGTRVRILRTAGSGTVSYFLYRLA